MATSVGDRKVFAYRRENGRVGVRNHVIILPVDDISNNCVEMVGNLIKGTLPLPHAYGRLQFGEDLDLHFRTMIGTGSNPNVAACVVIGIEPGWTQKVVDGIARTGKPVAGFSIEGNGDIATVAAASRKAKEFVHFASEKGRLEGPPAEAPARGPGLYFMDTSSAAAECCTLQAAAGYALHIFPTGQGNVIGNPIMPVIKVSGNPRTVRQMNEHIDVDVSGIIRREMTIDKAGDMLIDNIV